MPLLPLKEIAERAGKNYGTLRVWKSLGKISPREYREDEVALYDLDEVLNVKPRKPYHNSAAHLAPRLRLRVPARDSVRLSLTLTRAQFDRLTQLARATDVSVEEVINRSIDAVYDYFQTKG